MDYSSNSYYRSYKQVVFTALFFLVFCFTQELSAKVIGINPPTLLLTAGRINALPQAQRILWKQYEERSHQQGKIDYALFKNEIHEYKIQSPIVPPESRAKNVPLDKPANWYSTPKARRIADIIVSFQTPSGGWGKNLDFTKHLRAPGEFFSPYNKSQYRPKSSINRYPPFGGTFARDATITQLRYLAQVLVAVGPDQGAPYRASFLRGLDYIFSAQYPNGGWPQDWPLEEDYHDGITYKENAMVNILNLLSDIVKAKGEFAFIPVSKRAIAAASLKRGIQCVLATQIIINGHRTVWCQQHDALTLIPISARSYEMPAQVSSESAQIMLFLMKLPNPDPLTVSAVHEAVLWFEKTKILNVAFKMDAFSGHHLISAPGQGALWARFYEIGTDRPIFGDPQDPGRSVHDNVEDLSKKCRDGYGWYRESPQKVLKYYYAVWSKEH